MRQRTVLIASITCVLAVFAGTHHAAAQVSVSASASLSQPRILLKLSGVTEEISGTWFNVSVDLSYERYRFQISQHLGNMNPPDELSVVSRSAAQTTLTAGFEAKTWVTVETSYMVRTFHSPAGFQFWKVLAVGARPTVNLGIPSLVGYGRLLFAPIVSASLPRNPSRGLITEIGVGFKPPLMRTSFELHYRFERYDFPAAANRVEQFDQVGITVRVAIRDPSTVGNSGVQQ